MRIAYFTAGTVGAGHLVRGIAVGRGLRRAGFSGVYRMFGPTLPFALAAERADYETVDIRHDPALRSPHLAPGSEIADRLGRFRPDLLLVDMFWAPLYFVLPHLGCEAWLLVRICPPRWLEGPPAAPFEPAAYRRVVAIEPIDHPALTDAVDPIVVSNPDECRPAAALRDRFGVPPGEPLEVVLHAGKRGEMAELMRAAESPRPVTLDLRDPGTPFPAAEWLPGADRVVCGAGYNAFWEARWLRYAERTTFVPFRRTIDDQAFRVEGFGGHAFEENGADRLARWILG